MANGSVFIALKRWVKLSLLQTTLAGIKLCKNYQVDILDTSESETNWNG